MCDGLVTSYIIEGGILNVYLVRGLESDPINKEPEVCHPLSEFQVGSGTSVRLLKLFNKKLISRNKERTR